jgi:hypothetical protein
MVNKLFITIIFISEILKLIKQYPNDRTLIVFDIDNTLIKIKEDLGSDEWVLWQLSLLRGEPNDKTSMDTQEDNQYKIAHSADGVYDAWQTWLTHANYEIEPIEDLTKMTLDELREYGYKINFLTARNKKISSITHNHINKALNFSHRLHHAEYTVDIDENQIFDRGIISCNGCDKGQRLKWLLEHYVEVFNEEYEHVIFIDDSIHNVNNLRKVNLNGVLSNTLYASSNAIIGELSEESSKESSKELSGELSEESSKELSGELSEESSKELSGELSEESSKELSGELSEESSKESSKELSGELLPEKSDQINKQLYNLVIVHYTHMEKHKIKYDQVKKKELHHSWIDWLVSFFGYKTEF